MSIDNINSGPAANFDLGNLGSIAADTVGLGAGARAGTSLAPKDWFSALDSGDSHPITTDTGLSTTDDVDSIVNDMFALLGLPN